MSIPQDTPSEPVSPPFAWDPPPATGLHVDSTVPAAEPHYLCEDDLRPVVQRRVLLPAVLFIATLLSTFFAGATNWLPFLYLDDLHAAMQAVSRNWRQGLLYMAAVLGILLTHEMGHFLQAVRHRIPASWPLFLPVPILPTGTMGAVIGMQGSRADRRQLFDIGISGPLAGLAVTIPVLWLGIHNAGLVRPGVAFLDGAFREPLLFHWLAAWTRPNLPSGLVLDKGHPLVMAGWVGLLVTGLNMLPISQLDGGHVIYGLFGSRARVLARSTLITAIVAIIVTAQYNYSVILILVILLGVDHPASRDDSVRLGRLRALLGLASLALPVLCFTPMVN